VQRTDSRVAVNRTLQQHPPDDSEEHDPESLDWPAPTDDSSDKVVPVAKGQRHGSEAMAVKGHRRQEWQSTTMGQAATKSLAIGMRYGYVLPDTGDSLPMPVSDHDVHRAAHLLIAQCGDNTVAKARGTVETMRQRGDIEGADTWLRIIVAIGTLGTPPTDSRH
jgi:hypothetical protein